MTNSCAAVKPLLDVHDSASGGNSCCILKVIKISSAGLSIHTFHGNFFVRSTDLLSLPNVNPDAGFAVQMSIDENLDDIQVVSFQAALLYTSSKGAYED